MDKNWFAGIISRYPKAYYECLYNYRDYYPEAWKEKMRDQDEMLTYFSGHKLVVAIETVPGGRPGPEKYFRFRITGIYEIVSGYNFHSTAEARSAALEFCFMIRDFVLRSKEGLPVFSRGRIVGREVVEEKGWGVNSSIKKLK